MIKNTTNQDPDKMTHYKKYKRSINSLEPFLGIIGFILATALFFGCFFFLDYNFLSPRLFFYRGLGLNGPSASPPEEAFGVNGRPGFLDEGGDQCDVYDGNWVWDDNYPLYQSIDCPFMDSGFRCQENGRPDSIYTKWRWQPRDCNLPRFNAKEMLEKLRNRRVVFAGDSIGRNQWESLLCMLASVIPNKASIYEVNANPITKHQGFLVFMFEDYNCTVEYYRAPFLVYQGSPPAGAPKEVKMTVRVDTLSSTALQWKGADVLIFNSGHWWTSEKTTKQGCYFQEGAEVKMDMGLETAFQRLIETLADFVDGHFDLNKTLVLFRTHAPVHFRGGTWRTGGSCHLLKLPDLGSLPNKTEEKVDIVSNVLSKRSKKSRVMNLLNVTSMSLLRKDGHISIYHLGPGNGPAPLNRQDCSHWCLPGVPDSWNVLLYAVFLKWESFR